jgi:hypothetical protein
MDSLVELNRDHVQVVHESLRNVAGDYVAMRVRASARLFAVHARASAVPVLTATTRRRIVAQPVDVLLVHVRHEERAIVHARRVAAGWEAVLAGGSPDGPAIRNAGATSRA